ncbi:hypothetical protein [Citrobacter koseri]|uniref:hypothetical protein n=1 Tax=Citrobacter koseri TaxID=545 RepID=UPI001F36999F|nr:hypothetical protein [Citrobacter koseri]
MTNNKLTGLGANHPANGPLTTERLIHIRDVLQRKLKYSNGGSMDYIIADAVKAIDELLAGRKAEPMAWLWTNERLDKQSVSLIDPADEENAQDAMACGWKHQPLYTAAPVFQNGLQQWVSDVIEYLENGIEADGELEAQGSIDAKRLLAAAPQQEARKSNVIGSYQGADGQEHPIVSLSSPQEVK